MAFFLAILNAVIRWKNVLEKTNLCLTCLLVAVTFRFAKIRWHCFSATNSKITSTASTGVNYV